MPLPDALGQYNDEEMAALAELNDDKEVDPITGQLPLPNTARDPESREEKLRSYLMKRRGTGLDFANPTEGLKTYLKGKMAADERLLEPEYRQASRAPMNELQESNRGLSYLNLLQHSANQAGTLGGKAAPSGAFDKFTKDLQGQNMAAQQNLLRERGELEGTERNRERMMEYLATQYGKAGEKQSKQDRINALLASKQTDRLMKLQKDYGDEENIKNLNTLRDTYTSAQKLAANVSPLNDFTMLYQYVKANDPKTGVKDMELALATKAGSTWDKIASFAEGMKSGLMTDEKRAQLVDNMRVQAEAAEERAYETQQTYEDLAKSVGVDPNLVIGKRRSKYTPPKEETPPPPTEPQAPAAPPPAAPKTGGRMVLPNELPREEVTEQEHNEALQWARAHPDDPRAAKILQRAGGR